MKHLIVVSLLLLFPLLIVAFVARLRRRRPSQSRLVRKALTMSLRRWYALSAIEQQRYQAALLKLGKWAEAEIWRLSQGETPGCAWIGFVGDERGWPEVVISGPRDSRPNADEMQRLSEELGKPVFYTTRREGRHV